jgi:hypothetical protein
MHGRHEDIPSELQLKKPLQPIHGPRRTGKRDDRSPIQKKKDDFLYRSGTFPTHPILSPQHI